ncbi:hypothetical protein FACS189485_02800 [Spirochaetia bacterium]|nr:hypothetical protein FACS189485_02800 [Spirochaetia bacterium]
MFRKIPLLMLRPAFLAAVSLAAGVLLLALSFIQAPSGNADSYRSPYTVLVMDESAPDREITEALNRVFKGQVLSESSQWVFLDDFGQLRQIPLDEYKRRLEPFDPRNDGYAERLRSFFVRDGQRFFFIPQGGISEKKLAAALEHVRPVPAWSFAYGGAWQRQRQTGLLPQSLSGTRPRPLVFYLILFAASGLTGFFLLKPRFLGAVLFPVLAGLCLQGTSGFVLAAILSFLPDLLAEPVQELCCALSVSGRRLRRGEFRSRLLLNSVAPYRARWVFFPFLAAFYGFAALTGQVPLIFAVLSFLVFTSIFIFFFIAEAGRACAGDHIRFVPVLIIETPEKRLKGSKVMLPFALSACLALFFSSLSGPFEGEAREAWAGAPPLISAAEYQAHAEYQRHFSFLPLGGNGFDEDSYFHYDVDKDGLITKARVLEGDLSEAELSAIPPFPLESLMEFLGESAGPAGIEPLVRGGMRDMRVFDFVPVLMVLFLCLPALSGGRGKGKKRGPAIYNDKRIAA